MLSLVEANEIFFSSLKEELLNNGYFLKDGVFRKVRKDRLFIIEASLEITDRNRLSPVVKVADVKVKQKKDGSYRTKSGKLDDEMTYELAREEKSAFYKKLRHLKDLSLNEYEITEDEVLKIANSAFVAQNVCENRAIPKEYKQLMKNDVPFEKAAGIALASALYFFVVLTALSGLTAGLLVWVILGYPKFWGLFTVPYFYLVTAVISAIYGAVSMGKIRMGRF